MANADSSAYVSEAIGKVKPGAAVKAMVAGMKAEHAAAAKHAPAPDASALVDDLMASLRDARADRTQKAKAKAQLAAIEAENSTEVWWRTAREIADHVATHRHARELGHAGFRAIALRVFRGALVRATPRSHAAAFQVLLDDGFPAWHLARSVAVALETAARAGDPEAFAHFKKAVVKKTMAGEIERAAAACDEEKRPAIARQLRALL
jgi:hypothetical protein